ncbi:MAG: SpoIIE family protein phosphatase [Bacteroidetes bacterium]|nr:SpoIIE family protein phosphatase [Bacteroidota bacterium]MBL7104103.1 SpoIIE family protein phosphatase [Bacteroidales bacterium]
MIKNKGLAFKLSIYILTCSTFLFLLIQIYDYQVSKKLLLNEVKQNALQLTNATVNKIEKVIYSTQKIPSTLIYVMENSEIKENELLDMLSMIVKNNPDVFGSCIAFKPYGFFKEIRQYAPYYYKIQDEIKFKNLGTEDYDYFKWDWYNLPKTNNRAMWSEPYFDEGGGDVIMATYSVPFYDQKNHQEVFRGVITADISLDWLEELMNSIKIYKSGYAFLVSQTGTIITHPNEEFKLKESMFSLAEKYNRPDLKRIGEDMIKGNSQFLPYVSLMLNKPCRIYYAPMPETNWSMGVIFPDKELFAELDKLFYNTLLIGILGIIVLLVLIITISRNITSPLRKLAFAAEEIGSGNFNAVFDYANSAKEITMLGNTFRRMQQELKDYMRNLEKTTAAKEKIESELKIAHDIQQGMIPKIFPPFPDREDIDIYAVLEPARQVGGDLYDFFFLDDELLCFAIGDVSDKGVPSSLLMAITIALLRAKANKDLEVSEIVNSINKNISNGNDNLMFVTFFIGLLNLKTGELNYCNAGHNYPYLISQRLKAEEIQETHGTPLGIHEEQVYKSGKINLKKNDKLILYTDGVTEAMSKDGELYGDDRFLNLIESKCLQSDPEKIIKLILDDVGKFSSGAERADDITLLVLSYY